MFRISKLLGRWDLCNFTSTNKHYRTFLELLTPPYICGSFSLLSLPISQRLKFVAALVEWNVHTFRRQYRNRCETALETMGMLVRCEIDEMSESLHSIHLSLFSNYRYSLNLRYAPTPFMDSKGKFKLTCRTRNRYFGVDVSSDGVTINNYSDEERIFISQHQLSELYGTLVDLVTKLSRKEFSDILCMLTDAFMGLCSEEFDAPVGRCLIKQ